MTGWWVTSLSPTVSTIQSSQNAHFRYDAEEGVSAGISGHLFSGLWSLWAFTDFTGDFWRPVSASKNSVPGGRALGLRFLMAAGSKRRYRPNIFGHSFLRW